MACDAKFYLALQNLAKRFLDFASPLVLFRRGKRAGPRLQGNFPISCKKYGFATVSATR